jgi:hypothetical protein
MVEEGGIGTGRRGVGRETEMRSSSENEPSFRHGDEVPETTSGTERGTGRGKRRGTGTENGIERGSGRGRESGNGRGRRNVSRRREDEGAQAGIDATTETDTRI